MPRTAALPGRPLLLAIALSLTGCAAWQKNAAVDAAEPTGGAATSRGAGSKADGDDARPSARVPSVRLITAQTPAVRAYRKAAAAHIYKVYARRIFKGKLPPLMHAITVVETDIDATGRVTGVYFSRVPSHAPEVPAEIEALIRAASPLPSPGRLGGHTYVDTWLWDRSDKFQLDTLTQGQRDR